VHEFILVHCVQSLHLFFCLYRLCLGWKPGRDASPIVRGRGVRKIHMHSVFLPTARVSNGSPFRVLAQSQSQSQSLALMQFLSSTLPSPSNSLVTTYDKPDCPRRRGRGSS
jgi:hypothetical protein